MVTNDLSVDMTKKLKFLSLNQGRWIFRPYIPVYQRTENNPVDSGGFIKPVRLGSESDPWEDIELTYDAAMERLNLDEPAIRFSLRWLSHRYVRSREALALAPGTQKQFPVLARILDQPLKSGGKLGEVMVGQLDKPKVRQLRDKRLTALQAAGRSGYAHVNREISYLSCVIKWAMELYTEVDNNPFLIRKLKEHVNERYVSDEEYDAQCAVAGEVADYLRPVFELAYLTAARGSEVLDLRLVDITTDDDDIPAISVHRRKGSKDNYIKITPRLQAALDACKALRRDRSGAGEYIVPGISGPQLKKGTLDATMQRLRRTMKARGMTGFWTLHDLKHKGVSDAESDHIAGHKTEAMRNKYHTRKESYSPPE